MAKLTVIIGAGFSAPAGLPLARDINERFNRDQRKMLLQMSSSEWFWKDYKDETFIHNGSIPRDTNYYSYILDELVKKYISENLVFNDYEHFFEYLNTNCTDKKWLENVYAVAKKNFLDDHPHLKTKEAQEYLFFLEDQPFVSKLIGVINFLISDLLTVAVTPGIFDSYYIFFTDYLKQFDEVTIFTLNHDLLLERILEYHGIEYSRGFSKNDSPIYYEGNPLPVFNNDFGNVKVKIYKLHGSLDYFRFNNIDNFNYTNKYNYFITSGYREKHFATRVNLETKEVIQDFNADIIPKFITGKNKPAIIKNDTMFSALFEHFETEVATAENLLVSGYSYSDEHINEALEKRNNLSVVNNNRSKDYPFSCSTVRNIKSLGEL